MNEMTKFLRFFLLGLCITSTAFCITDYSRITMEVLVSIVDENGNPLPKSEVNIYFQHTYPQERALRKSGNLITKVYDGENKITAKYSGRNSLGVRVEKEGYWRSQLSYRFAEKDRIDVKDGSPNGHYRKEFTVVMRKKENPRPLYVNRVGVWVPGFNQPFGFDLEKADWVAPHGKGVHSDFIFTFKRELKTFHVFRGDMALSFSNPSDGVVKVVDPEVPYSRLLLGKYAPLGGYTDGLDQVLGLEENEGVYKKLTKPTVKELDRIKGYWFRVRSGKLIDGVPQDARYGKVLGHFSFEVRNDNPTVSFTYFFSPDTSRSLEWNGENLLPEANLQGVDKY
ncbi:hypothetical protein P3T73_01090 [Kiritimatiellota bacterium B12222]|nr:hypothetical protein P3T73_01090 [Kiritimatiellota bacterium B12222]